MTSWEILEDAIVVERDRGIPRSRVLDPASDLGPADETPTDRDQGKASSQHEKITRMGTTDLHRCVLVNLNGAALYSIHDQLRPGLQNDRAGMRDTPGDRIDAGVHAGASGTTIAQGRITLDDDRGDPAKTSTTIDYSIRGMSVGHGERPNPRT